MIRLQYVRGIKYHCHYHQSVGGRVIETGWLVYASLHIHLDDVPPVIGVTFERHQLLTHTLFELNVFDYHKVDVFEAVAQNGHHLVFVHFRLIDALGEFAHEGVAHQGDFDTLKEKHREAVALGQERVWQFDGQRILDVLHVVGVIEGTRGLVDVPQRVGNHPQHAVDVLVQGFQPVDDVMHLFEDCVDVEGAVAQGFGLVQTRMNLALHRHRNPLARAHLHLHERRFAQICVGVEDDAQLHIGVPRVQQFQIGGVRAQATVPMQNAVLPVVTVLVVVVLLALDDFQPTIRTAT